MHKKQLPSWFWMIVNLSWIFMLILPTNVHAQTPVVRAVLFFSPTCGHCEKVITQDLPPLAEKYGDQLQIILINVTVPVGQELFLAAMGLFGLEETGVPFLVIADQYLVGSIQIPEIFPGLVEQYMALGGVDWPEIPGLKEALQAAEQGAADGETPVPTEPVSAQESTPTEVNQPTESPTAQEITGEINPGTLSTSQPPGASSIEIQSEMLSIGNQGSSLMERLSRDPAGNTLSVIVLAGMLAVLVGAAVVFPRPVRGELPVWQDWLLPILALIGISVAAYLAYIEITQVTAVCGPVGDCNTVNQSEYAHLFGVLPVGVLGISGYILILFAWLVHRLATGRWGDLAALCLLGLTTFGLLFSIYLTFLEPFVIGATCAWCLTSAFIMTALFWLSLRRGKEAWKRVKGFDD